MVAPYTEVHIDFDEDGVFESGEEVFADIRQMSITRGVDVAKHRALAAQLDMSLNNFDHKYSPSNDESPLYPFQLPGPHVRVRSGYPYDSFDAASAGNLDGRTPDVGSELTGNWSASASMVIKENASAGVYEVVGITATGTRIATLDYGETNVAVAARIRRPTASPSFPYKQPLFTFRYVDASNYSYVYLREVNGSTDLLLCFAEVVATVDTELSTVAIGSSYVDATVWPDGEFVDVEARITGDACEVYIFGETAFTHQFTGLTRVAGTEHGIGGAGFTTGTESSTAGQSALWDNYGLLTQFYGRVDTVEPRPSSADSLAYIRAYDDFERMAGFNLFTSTPDTPATAGDIAERILERSEFSRGSLLDAGTTLTPAPDSNQDTRKVIAGNALEEMYQLQDDEVGLAYIARNGVFHFEAADHRELNDHDLYISVWYWQSEDEPDGQPKHIAGPIEWDDGKERVENQIFYQYFRQSKTLGATVWFLQVGDDPQFDFTNRTHPTDSGYAVIDIVAVGDGDAVADPKIPLPLTDFSIWETAGGTGQNWLTALAANTGTVTMVNGPTTFTLDDTSAPFAGSTSVAGLSYANNTGFVVIEDASGNAAVARCGGNPDGDNTKVNLLRNPEETGVAGLIASDPDFDETDGPLSFAVWIAGCYLLPGYEGNYQFLRFIMPNTITLPGSSATTAFVTSAQLKASRLTASVPAATRAEDSASQLTYGLRRVQHETKHVADWDVAQGRAEKRLQLRKDARERVSLYMYADTPQNLMEMLYREVSDRVRVIYPPMGIDRDHNIEQYRLEYTAGNWLTMRWELTRVVPDDGRNYLWGDAATIWGAFVWAPPS